MCFQLFNLTLNLVFLIKICCHLLVESYWFKVGICHVLKAQRFVNRKFSLILWYTIKLFRSVSYYPIKKLEDRYKPQCYMGVLVHSTLRAIFFQVKPTSSWQLVDKNQCNSLHSFPFPFNA